MELDGKRVLQATVRDITERKRIEEALQKEKDNLAAIFAASPIGMLLLDEETMIVDANAALAAMVLRDPAEIIQQRGIGVLGCIHSRENEKGCGYSQTCPACPLRNSISAVLTSGTRVHGAEIQPTRLHRWPGRTPLAASERRAGPSKWP